VVKEIKRTPAVNSIQKRNPDSYWKDCEGRTVLRISAKEDRSGIYYKWSKAFWRRQTATQRDTSGSHSNEVSDLRGENEQLKQLVPSEPEEPGSKKSLSGLSECGRICGTASREDGGDQAGGRSRECEQTLAELAITAVRFTVVSPISGACYTAWQ